MPRRTQLYEYHQRNGKLTEFSGFEMPLWYSSISEEHLAVRNSAGLFDVSHMGRFMIRGSGASEFLSNLLSTNCNKIQYGRCFYSVICNEEGGIIDDVITSKFSSSQFYVVVNASNRAKDFDWLRRLSSSYDVALEDLSDATALIAFQGPLAASLLQQAAEQKVSELKRFSFTKAVVFGQECLVSRTGYTGEDGYEITLFDSPINDATKALKIWNGALDIGKNKGVVPCGLGARDTLRLEAGLCLYGQDIDESTSPLEASLDSVIDFDREFIGRKNLEMQKKSGLQRKRVAFVMLDAGIPRHSCEVRYAGVPVGTVTSGSYSPLLKKGIGMAYVPPNLSSVGQKLSIMIRGSDKTSEVSSVPLYDTCLYGYKRK